MHFASEEHKARFLEKIQRIDKVEAGKVDPEYGAAVYLLSCMPSVWEKTRAYVRRDGIPFGTILLEEHFSSSELAMVQLAGNLFNLGITEASPVDLVILDGRNFEVALAALRFRRDGASIDAAESRQL